MRTLLGAVMLGLTLACGGGGGSGGGDGGGGTAPTISHLQYGPTSAVLNQGGGTTSVTGTFDFSDPDGDVTTLRLTTAAGHLDTPIQGASGVKVGTLGGVFAIHTAQLGHFTFEVSLLDGKGHQSNSLPGGFDVVPDDGATQWTSHPAPAALNAEQFWGVAWSGTRYVAVGTHGAIMWSADAATWSQSTSPVTTDLYRATWTGTQFVAVGDRGTILTSPDGAAWTLRRASGIAGNILSGVAASGSTVVAVGVSPTSPYTTAVALSAQDGVTWTPCPAPATLNGSADSRLVAVAASGSGFLAVGDGDVTGGAYDRGLVWTSPDGLTWSAACPRGQEWAAVVWGNHQYVASGVSGAMTSPDGITWTSVASPWAGYEVAWSGAHFLSIVNTFTANLYPPDFAASGTTLVNLPSLWFGHGQLIWGHHQWVCPGAPGTVCTSP